MKPVCEVPMTLPAKRVRRPRITALRAKKMARMVVGRRAPKDILDIFGAVLLSFFSSDEGVVEPLFVFWAELELWIVILGRYQEGDGEFCGGGDGKGKEE